MDEEERLERTVAGSGAVALELLALLERGGSTQFASGFAVALDAAKTHPDWFAAIARQFRGPAMFDGDERRRLDWLVHQFPVSSVEARPERGGLHVV